ncbi:MAG: RNA-binding transcriptional accessory protein, partial [Thermoanaerobaculia bacterium]|nr:RNA-binding transcriptional accessory protein [Thermoanaerobaculia bacterium]
MTDTARNSTSVDRLEDPFVQLIAAETGSRPMQVRAASSLFADGSTVPFVARYRKEATGGLDDEALERIAKRRAYFLELQVRRDTILESVADQGHLTEELERAIRAATSKQELEDLYLPYKPKRRTRAQIARQKGLEPFADLLLDAANRSSERPEKLAASFLDAATGEEHGLASADDALAGARDILAERLSEDAVHRAALRKTLRQEGELSVRVLSSKEDDPKAAVYRNYFDHTEPARNVKSHRLLAILRGEREGILLSDLAVDDEHQIFRLGKSWGVPLDTPCGRHVLEATADGYRRLLRPSITNEVRGELRETAESEAIEVFRDNLEALLLQSPLGLLPVMGLDPGLRTGCKLAVVDGTSRVVATDVLYAVGTSADASHRAAEKLADLVKRHRIHAIAVGNGTASRETEQFARNAVRDAGLEVIVAIVPETGASVYSASKEAREELPDLDVSLRGAVSIARRLQDPMAELVKIEPKSLGVGQYQHDVDQRRLSGELDLAVESVVNKVGVELNTASQSLLRRVSGLSERLAKNVVDHRGDIGVFKTRKQLLDVSGFGPKTFEQAAGFLRIHDGEHPLDRTAVHPERYELVERIADAAGTRLPELVGSPQQVAGLDLGRFVDEKSGVGRFTLEDIKTELEKPGRDPRPEFTAPEWRDDVTSLEDLRPGMNLEGRISNVTNFGAFVDL